MKMFTKKILSKEDLQAISSVIAEIEKKTAGEIRVVLRHHRHLTERRLSLHELAFKEFTRLGMQKTKHRSGILIFLLVSERKFQIIADEGIHKKVEDGTWEGVASAMSSHFRERNFRKGVIEALRSVGDILARHCPPTPGDVNELPNEVVED